MRKSLILWLLCDTIRHKKSLRIVGKNRESREEGEKEFIDDQKKSNRKSEMNGNTKNERTKEKEVIKLCKR